MRDSTASHNTAFPGVAGGILLALALGPAALGQPADLDASRLALSVDDHRPLSALADQLEKRYQVTITYEEGPWVAAADVEDYTQAIIQANGPGKAAPAVPILGPRKAAVSFEYALSPAKGRPTDYADLLSALLFQYDAAGAPGQFRFEGDRGIYHLIPARLVDADGQWSEVQPVLSTPVRLADEERSVDDTLDEIVAQLNEASPVKVGWGYVPLNLFVQTRIRLAADGVPAREVMRQILELLPRRATWRLNYDPTTKKYYLSFLLLPGGR
ncbi:MAG TPA: hypothetical protein VF017_07170 [Thermoanaerobaculia bacterium]|nr:hypothetical protein [Thermoanaerobaculia bacterium]